MDYSIFVKLNSDYNEENISSILKNGAKLNFIYHEYIFGESNFDSEHLSIENAIKFSLRGAVDEPDLHCLETEVGGTYLRIHFLNYNPNLGIMFSSLSPEWSKQIITDQSNEVDLVRYTKIMLDLINDFEILELKIEGD